MPFPPGFARLSPGDLKVFRQFYEESVEAQPMDKLGAWFLSTYDHLEAGEFTHALGLLDEVLRKSPDYSGFLAAKHLLSQVDSCSGVTYQIAKRLLAHPSPLIVRYGLCLVIAGEVPLDRSIADAVASLSFTDEETMDYGRLAKLAIQRGDAQHG
jgi:hypothetical protein